MKLLHTKQFHHRSGLFDGWTDFQQLKFATDLFDTAKPYVAGGISISVHKANWDKRRHAARSAQNVSAYGQCFRDIVGQLLKDDKLRTVRDQCINDGLSMLIEAGNQNNAGVLNAYNKYKKEEAYAWFKHLGFIDKKSCCAIQLADFLAFYSRRFAATHFDEKTKPKIPTFLYLAKSTITTVGQLAEDLLGPRRPRLLQRDHERTPVVGLVRRY